MTLETVAIRLYGALARAFPDQFDHICGPEMAAASEDLLRREAKDRGSWRLLLLLPRLFCDVLVRLVIEHVRDASRDARYAARLLARSPGFTLSAVLCLSIGVGLTAAMYSQIRSTVFREIPGVREAGGLARLQRPIAFADYQELRRHTAFTASAAFLGPVPLVLSVKGAPPVRVWGHIATPEYFDVLGTRTAAGRFFGPEHRVRGGAPVAVISHSLWQLRFGGDPGVIGRSIGINGQPFEVLGVAEAGFVGASPTTAMAEIWIPTTAPARIAPELAALDDRHSTNFGVVARLAAGVSYTQAEEALEPLVRHLEMIRNDPKKDSKERRVRLLPGGRMFPVRDEDLPKAIGFPLLLIALVILMACGNVANMLLARSVARRREMAVRLSLGAGPGRIVRQLLTESVLLSLLGAGGGLLFALWFTSVIGSTRPMIPSYVHFETRLDWASLAVALLIATVFSFVFGLVPALRSGRADVHTGLTSRTASGGSGRRWLNMRNVLVFQQVAVSTVLLLLTGFVVIGWQRSAKVDVGLDPANLYLVNLDPVRDGYSPDRAAEFFRRLPERFRNTPGITGVSLAQTLPLAMSSGDMMMNAKVEFAGSARSFGAMRAERVGAGFFRSVGTPLRSGREFDERDERDGASVIVVNETMAQKVWPNEQAIGQTIELEGRTREVVGVVGDIRSAFPLAPRLPAVFQPATPAGFEAPAMYGVTVLVRVAPGFDASTRLRRLIEAGDPNVTVFQIKPVVGEIEAMLYVARFATFVYGGMGVFGLVLASVGLAGVTAYAVARRTNEIGIRMALGATRGRVLALVLREGGAIILAGTLTGLALALAAARALASSVEALAQATSTSVSDPLVVVGGPALLALVALAACYVPARRSMRIDPVVALRTE